MKAERLLGVVSLSVLLTSCSVLDGSQEFTLYRNSINSTATRIHFASFDTREGGAYNQANCLMAARLMNANMTAKAKEEGDERDESRGFWCEPGGYKEDGQVPSYFNEDFPTDA